MVQAFGLPGAGRSPLHFNKKYSRLISNLLCYKAANSKWLYFHGAWAGLSGQAQPGRTGVAWPDWRSLAGYKQSHGETTTPHVITVHCSYTI